MVQYTDWQRWLPFFVFSNGIRRQGTGVSLHLLTPEA